MERIFCSRLGSYKETKYIYLEYEVLRLELLSKEAMVGQLLLKGNYKLLVAESCTGGLISHLITNIPGSSEYYLGGLVTYDYLAKERLLGVHHQTLEKFGAVSEETALEMAAGARRLLSGDYPIERSIGISATGIAGPGGATPDKPVGLVWIGMDTPRGSWGWKHIWDGNRLENKTFTAQAALDHLIDFLSS